MYTLRILTKITREDGIQTCHTENFDLGESYSVYDKYSDEAKSTLEDASEETQKGLRYILRGEKGPTFLIMNKNYGVNTEYRYYIVGESGKTLESLNRV